ncbi:MULTISPECIES: SDR family NAD(P)-dependent oxidoreductase [unclassified Sphingomonas]|jgi:short-subunit dehydrogenase|uniref:SDR family NAD(P)-dependent oxidoreductase n=1 Tax=unclassified Sphingomonas TaxID=196159 RepID=UPI00082EDBBA|nr:MULTISPECIES: SDR family oxidoreductase [unclassified Sphingomonas]MCH4893956.1 SDR family NAD(P)-dependent oxidoreductase [Sphingomonas sp. SFZ2018-12]
MSSGTALVTGASAGLGAGFARALADDGHDLILTARRADRLETLAGELRDRFKIKVEVIGADLGQPGAARMLIDEVTRRGLSVDTLVNNAGFGQLGAFVDQPINRLDEMLDLNCRAVMDLCRLVLPGMIDRRAGGILNIASTAAFQPGPGMAVYYATKAFVLSLSEALHEEARPHGVRVAALCPGPTITEFAGVAGMRDTPLFQRFAVRPGQVVEDGMRALKANDAVKISGFTNRVMAFSNRLTPRGMVRRLVGSLQSTRE